jgi:hypothetical protein
MVWGWGLGGSEIGQGTFLKQGVSRRSRRSEPSMLEVSIKYVIWLCKQCILIEHVYVLPKKINKKSALSLNILGTRHTLYSNIIQCFTEYCTRQCTYEIRGLCVLY